MRKIALIGIAFITIVCFATFSFAQGAKGMAPKKTEQKMEIVKGIVTSIDPTKNEIVITEDKTGVNKTIVVNPKRISSLKVGEHLKITLNPGGNIAESIVVIKKHMTKK